MLWQQEGEWLGDGPLRWALEGQVLSSRCPGPDPGGCPVGGVQRAEWTPAFGDVLGTVVRVWRLFLVLLLGRLSFHLGSHGAPPSPSLQAWWEHGNALFLRPSFGSFS